MKKFIVGALLCVAAIQLRSEPEIKGSATELSTYLAAVPKPVTLSAESEVKVPADKALISLKVITENKSLQEASHLNQDIRARLLKKLSEQGIPADRVKPSKFSSTPKFGVFKDKAKSYAIENTVRITAMDEKEFQAVASLVDAISEVRYESVEFENADKEGLKARATAEAIEEVTAKKKVYEEKLGVKLTPRQFSEGTRVPSIENMAMLRKQYAVSSSVGVSPSFSASSAFSDDAAEVPTSFNELVYRASVVVEYALEAK